MSSPRPSAKAASSGSAPWVLKGRTTIQGAPARPGLESGRLPVAGDAARPESISWRSARSSLPRSLARLKSILGRLLQAAADDPAQVRRQPGLRLAQRRRLVLEDRRQELDRARPRERPLPRRHLVEHHAQREDVGPVVQRPARDLLRRHVGHRPQHDALARVHVGRQLGAAGPLRHRTAHPARGRSRGPSRVRPSSTMTFAGFRSRWTMPLSCAATRASASPVAISRIRSTGSPPSGMSAVERLALDELHGQEVDAVGFLDGVDGDDAGVVEGGERLRLAPEALEPLRARGHLGRAAP